MRSTILVSAALIWTSFPSIGGAVLVGPGDLTIIGYRSDSPDGFAFVTWIDLDASTTINFWDSGYVGGGDGSGEGSGGGTWRASEHFMTWSTDGTTLSAGTVVVVSENPLGSNAIVDAGTATGQLNVISSSGDQIFAGQGSFTGNSTSETFSGTLAFGFDFEQSAGWDSSTSNDNDSALPGALNSSDANLSFDEKDNGQYVGARTGMTIPEYKAAIADPSNWMFSDDGIVAFGALNSTDFSITSVPEPSAFAFLGLVATLVGMGVGGAKLRKKRGSRTK